MTESLITYGVQLKEYDSSASGNYYEIPLTEDIKSYDVSGGDPLHLSLENDEDPAHLRIDFKHTGTRHNRKLKQKNGSFRVSFPKEFLRSDAYNSPFSDLRNGDKVNVEYNSDHLRVYTPEDYRKRTSHLVEEGRTPEFKIPVGALLAGSAFADRPDGFTDVAAETQFEGQRVRIKPFEGLTELFQEEASAEASQPIVTQKDFYKVLEKGGLDSRQVDFLKVYWNPSPVDPRSPEKGKSILGGFGKETWELVLPKHGAFVFEAQFGGDTSETFLTYCDDVFKGLVEPDIGNEWFGLYVDVDREGVIEVYIPVPSFSEEDGGISWQSGSTLAPGTRKRVRLERVVWGWF